MPDLKYRSLILQIFKYFGIHLQVHLKYFSEYWIQAIEEHPCLMFSEVRLGTILSILVIEFLDEALIFFEDGASYH